MSATEVRLVPPMIRCWAVLIGTMAWSSRLVVESDPAEVSTPITWYGTLLMVTSCPTGSKNPNSSLAVSEPSTTTAAADDWSAASMNRPSDTDRPRTGSQDGVVPTTVVVQFADPFTSSCELLCDTGATPATSGAASLEFSASASAVVSVVRRPEARPYSARWWSCPARRSAGCRPARPAAC